VCGRANKNAEVNGMAWIERNLKWILIGCGIVLLVAAIVQFFTTMPPRSITWLAGRQGGAYYLGAEAYQRLAQARGFDIDIVETAGSVEALQMLEMGQGDVAFIQGGVAAQGDPEKVSTLATVAYEPLWIFYRKELAGAAPLDSFSALNGKRIAIGEPNSGTNQLAKLLLAQTGLESDDATLLEISSADAAAGLQAGELDAALFVSNQLAPVVQQLLADPNVELMNLRYADALARRNRFLSVTELPRGTFNIVNDVPREDIKLLTTRANLMVRAGFHPDLLRLLSIAAVQLHSGGGLFAEPDEFPNTIYTDLPVSREAKAYLEQVKSGDSQLDRYLPFWLAALIDRYLLFVVPLLLIFVPLIGRSPLLYQWYMRNKVTRWYKTVHTLEQRVDSMQVAEVEAAIAELEALDEKLARELTVSNTYMPSVYDLRTHIQYVISQLQKRYAKLAPAAAMETLQAAPAAAP
jgi:TRAP transporter TAXI family solute receptor